MATLEASHKEFIVKRLARMKQPVDVIGDVKQEFGIEVSRQQISFYNPETTNGSRLSKKWRHLFYDTRRKYVEKESASPIFHKGYRMNEIQDLYNKAKKMGNIVLALQILEQAAKESGGFYEKGKFPVPPDEAGMNYFQQINQTIVNQQKGNSE